MKSVFENMVVRKKSTAPEATETASNNSEKSVNQMSSGEYEATLRSNRSLRQQIDGSTAVRHVDLSKSANNERYAVLRPCAGCGTPEHRELRSARMIARRICGRQTKASGRP